MVSKGKLSLIFGVIGFLLQIFWYVALRYSLWIWYLFLIIPAIILISIILSIVFGIWGIKRRENRIRGVIGLILGVITLVGGLYMWLLLFFIYFIGI